MPLYPRLDLNFSITDLQVLVIFDPNHCHGVHVPAKFLPGNSSELPVGRIFLSTGKSFSFNR